MTASPRLYLGRVIHCRHRPVWHRFVHRVFFVQLPLDKLEVATSTIFSIDRFNVLSFHRRDHGPRDGSDLRVWLDRLLHAEAVFDVDYVVLQTFPRILGYVFNPISFWMCYRADGALLAVLAEVNNTFGDTHSYLVRHADGRPLTNSDVVTVDKQLHVSPFNRVEGSYRFRFRVDEQQVAIFIDYADERGQLLRTSISGRGFTWRTSGLVAAFMRQPLLTVGVVAKIHWQALRLWLKGVRFLGSTPPPKPLQQMEAISE